MSVLFNGSDTIFVSFQEMPNRSSTVAEMAMQCSICHLIVENNTTNTEMRDILHRFQVIAQF